jgi:hypothetical protein
MRKQKSTNSGYIRPPPIQQLTKRPNKKHTNKQQQHATESSNKLQNS